MRVNLHSELTMRILINSCLVLMLVVAPAVLTNTLNIIIEGSAVIAAEERKPPKSRRTVALRAAFAKKIKRVQELAQEENNYKEALAILDTQKERVEKLNSAEQTSLWNFYGFIYQVQEQYGKALIAYVNLINVENVDPKTAIQVTYQVAQLYMVQEDYDNALKYLLKWQKEVEFPTASSYYMLAQIYYTKERYRKIPKAVLKALEIAEAQKTEPKEAWYKMLQAAYYQLEDYNKMEKVVQHMVMLYDKADDWTQLAAIYAQLNKEDKQLQTYDIAYKKGYLTKSSQLRTYASLLLANEIPYKAGKVLEKAMNKKIVESNFQNLKLLAACWLASHEYKKAIAPLEEASSISDDGKTALNLAQTYYFDEKFDQTIKLANRAIQKGGLGNKLYIAHEFIGMSYLRKHEFAKATLAFKRAKKNTKNKKAVSVLDQRIKNVTEEKKQHEHREELMTWKRSQK